MRAFIQNLRIGIKLVITSGVGILLTAGLVYLQIDSNHTIRTVNQNVRIEQLIARDAIDIKASVRGMQATNRDAAFAATSEDLRKSADYLVARKKSALGFADEMSKLARLAETRADVANLKTDILAYMASAERMISLRDEALRMNDSDMRAAAVESDARDLARDLIPMGVALEAQTNKIIAAAKPRVDAEEAAANAEMTSAERNALLVGALVAVLLMASCVLSIVTIARPIQSLARAMRELADGNFAVVLPGLGRRDEVGDVAGAVDRFKVMAQEKAARDVEVRHGQEREAAAQRKSDMRKLADQFETAVGEIIETVTSASSELEVSANSLTRTADTTRSLSTAVAAASEQASSNVQSVATASEEMASSVNEISRQVQESARIAGDAVAQAHRTNVRVNALSKAADRIGDVVGLISTVAGQTNLLALNATIEAARAGDAGRGFAVVASEVKALAAQTAKATDEISQQIGDIQAATRESVQSIDEIGGTIARISEIASAIAAAVEQQGAATQEVSRNVQQAAQGTQQVASSITDVQRGASETGSASAQVLSAAQLLSQDSTRLRAEVEKFLGTVRAA